MDIFNAPFHPTAARAHGTPAPIHEQRRTLGERIAGLLDSFRKAPPQAAEDWRRTRITGPLKDLCDGKITS